jgi:hypothetical protein
LPDGIRIMNPFTDNALPDGIRIMNPFTDNSEALEISSEFYRRFYSDHKPRKLILGINPGRFGAGVTGIPFTDTRRLQEKCGLQFTGLKTHEPSSVFVYEMIDAFGGVDSFYSQFYISAVCPLGFVAINEKGREVNYNYYDSSELMDSVREFIIGSLERQLEFGIDTSLCICLGTGKNFKYLQGLNREKGWFDKILPVEHPRFIMQYRSGQKDVYVRKYLELLRD